MRSNLDGTWLDGDGRPVPPPAPAGWKELPGRTRWNLISHYLGIVGNAVLGAAAIYGGSQFHEDWLLMVGLVLILAFTAQILLVLVVRRATADVVHRRMSFAAANAFLTLLLNAALLGVLAVPAWVDDISLGPVPMSWIAAVMILGVADALWRLRVWVFRLRVWPARPS